MELLLQQDLPHQQKAIDAVCDALEDVSLIPPTKFYENPQINLSDSRLKENLKELQKAVLSQYRNSPDIGNCLNLDIKMETGTGKTYVYTKTIYELNKRYGLNKFIIFVPSLAIKFGTSKFINDEYSRRHFADCCGYGTEIELEVLETSGNKKKTRNCFPDTVSEFVKGSRQNRKKIYVLIVNMHLLTANTKRNGKDTGLLWRDDYDNSVEGFYRPFDAIKATKPVAIIDEPHRFSRNQKTFQIIMNEIQPQLIIRYGATFPEKTKSNGKNKSSEKDYQYLLYDLNACQAFNLGLIKCIAKEHIEIYSKQKEIIKIVSIKSKDTVTFQQKNSNVTKSFNLKKGDPLSIINNSFEGITISNITSNSVEFSNGVIKTVGEKMYTDVYMSSYQEQMLRLALQRHFETERKNFCNRNFKIKTLALFFIDDISSYRHIKNGKPAYLLSTFEKLLKEQILLTLSSLEEHESSYREYLQASLENINACHAGYFSQDNKDSEEEVAKEIDIILNGKKQLLSFKNDDGSYNTLRFLFSKWTLKEGWDNPNVFTIAKLRSSGSEESKLQEIGRGLRLPVDENGSRISNEEFYLNYIVDFTEADFVKELIDMINDEIPQSSYITEEQLISAAKELGITDDELFDELRGKHYIDRHYNILPETRNMFFSEYPMFNSGVSTNKIIDNNKNKPKNIIIRKEVYKEIKTLWENINQKYILLYDRKLNDDMPSVVLSILEKANIFTKSSISSSRHVIKSDGKHITSEVEAGVQYTLSRSIPYGEFLRKIMNITGIPITVLHNALIEYCKKHGTINEEYINESSVDAFCSEFKNWKVSNLKERFHYEKINSPVGNTALSYSSGTPKGEIELWRVGKYTENGTTSKKYLYDIYAYDSPLEKNNILSENENIVVYGKIPKNSISIPTITGETYSPDFMCIVKKKDSDEKLSIVIETKDVEGKNVLRNNEIAKIECAKIFFKTLTENGYKIYFKYQPKYKTLAQIIEDIINDSI